MSRRASASFVIAVLSFTLAFSGAAPGDAPAPEPGPGGIVAPKGLAGFRATDAAAELAREELATDGIRPDSLRRDARVLTAVAHVAGTPGDRANAEFVRDRFTAYGWDARIVEVPVWLNWPKHVALELVEPNVQPLALREAGVEWDKDAYDSGVFDAFHGYSASGDVTAPVVYANYGDVDDFAALAKLGVDVRGHIALVRYGKIFRGLKVRNAERAGCSGVVIYSDPADDGYDVADPYPRGPARPADAIQRGSVQFLSEAPGDPTTPGWPSTAGGKRLKPSEARGVPHIPSLPLSYAEAGKILERLEGPPAPHGWQGGLPFTYHVGSGPAVLHLVSEQDYAVRPIWNVIATLKGREQPGRMVMCGNHRDAWNHGAIDPNSGTIAELEMARAIGGLAKRGWRPRRTIVLASWDGEEYGLLGSTEWAEANAADLTANAVAYINVDAACSGKDLRVSACSALGEVIEEAMRDVRDPASNRTLWNAAVDHAWSDGKLAWSAANRERRLSGEPEEPFDWSPSPLGSGSDYTAFVDHLGIASADLRFSGVAGTYHSAYDDFEYLDRIVDPGYLYHVALTDLWTRVTLRLAEAEALPLRYSATGRFALDELESLADRAEDAGAGKVDSLRFGASLAGARAAAAKLRDAAAAAERAADAALERGDAPALASWNEQARRAERDLLGPGLPGREWFRHELLAPGLNTGYAPVPLPRLGQALLDNDVHAWASGIAPLTDALSRAAGEFASAPR